MKKALKYVKKRANDSLGFAKRGWRWLLRLSAEKRRQAVELVVLGKQKAAQTLRYWYSLSYWYCLNSLRAFGAYLKAHADLARRASFILVALCAAWFANTFGLEYFTQEILSDYLIAVGTMTGAAIAILFTISLTAFTTSSSAYPALFSVVDESSYREKITYFLVGVITLIHLGAGLYIGGLHSLTNGADGYSSPVALDTSALITIFSLLLVGIVFVLIDWQYKTIKEKSDPFFAIGGFERKAISNLKRMQRDAEAIADILQAKDPSISRDMARATARNRVLHSSTSDLERKLISLIEVGLQFSERQEVHTTRRAFTAVYNILSWFFEVIKTSSLVVPSGLAFLGTASDSQNFLSRVFEKLNDAGEKFIKDGKGANATYIIDVYKSLAFRAHNITFIGRSNDNPILDLIVGYLQFLIDNGRKAKNNEVVFQGIQALGEIAVTAARNGKDTTLFGLQQKMLEIAQYGMVEKYTTIVDQCTSDYLRIIGAVFGSSEIVRRHSFDNALKNIASIAGQLARLVNAGYLPNDFTTRMSMGKGYDDMHALLVGIMNHYTSLTDEREKRSYRSDIVEFFDELGMTLRQLSETIKDADSTLVGSVGRLLVSINELIIDLILDDEFKNNRRELERCLHRNIHLPYWFTHHAEKFDAGSISFHSLTDCVAKTGILIAERLRDKHLMKDCIDCLHSITDEALKKTTSQYGFDEPRVLKKACYLGILALKRGWRDIFATAAVKIYDFEPKYAAKYFRNLPAGIDPDKVSPRKDQLFIELLHWRDDFSHEKLNRDLRLHDDAESMMYPIIDEIDIDRFMFEVWHKFPADSAISGEVELKGARIKLVRVLQKLVILRQGNPNA